MKPQTIESFDHANFQFYPGVYTARITLLTYPASTCTAERSFSMKRLHETSSSKYHEGRELIELSRNSTHI